jgi:hypothetical protein
MAPSAIHPTLSRINAARAGCLRCPFPRLYLVPTVLQGNQATERSVPPHPLSPEGYVQTGLTAIHR